MINKRLISTSLLLAVILINALSLRAITNIGKLYYEFDNNRNTASCNSQNVDETRADTAEQSADDYIAKKCGTLDAADQVSASDNWSLSEENGETEEESNNIQPLKIEKLINAFTKSKDNDGKALLSYLSDCRYEYQFSDDIDIWIDMDHSITYSLGLM